MVYRVIALLEFFKQVNEYVNRPLCTGTCLLELKKLTVG